MENLIAFTGYMQSGKSTCANYVWQQRNGERYNACTFPFATPIKEIARRVGYKGIKTKQWRKFLQKFGSMCRKINPDIFIDLWEQDIDMSCELWGYKLVLNDDLRYGRRNKPKGNEAECIKALGGKIVLVTRPESIFKKIWRFLFAHESERGIDKQYVDYTINNNGTLEDLEKEVAKMLEYFKI